ncbi:MAG: Hpt domain-containing protein [Anaerotignaceae bacterium]
MNEKNLKKAGIDCLAGIRRFSGSADLYEKYLKKFTDDENFKLAKKAMEEKNYEDVLKYIHTLKGVTGNLSMTELFDSCSELVTVIRNKDLNGVDEIFHKICLLHSKVCEAIHIENEN